MEGRVCGGLAYNKDPWNFIEFHRNLMGTCYTSASPVSGTSPESPSLA